MGPVKPYFVLTHCLTPEKGIHSSSTSCSKCVHQILLLFAHASMHAKCIYALAGNNRFWCTHLESEVPKWVYALFWCKTVDSDKNKSVFLRRMARLFPLLLLSSSILLWEHKCVHLWQKTLHVHKVDWRMWVSEWRFLQALQTWLWTWIGKGKCAVFIIVSLSGVYRKGCNWIPWGICLYPLH